MYYENLLNSVQVWFPGFSAVYHYPRFGMASKNSLKTACDAGEETLSRLLALFTLVLRHCYIHIEAAKTEFSPQDCSFALVFGSETRAPLGIQTGRPRSDESGSKKLHHLSLRTLERSQIILYSFFSPR